MSQPAQRVILYTFTDFCQDVIHLNGDTLIPDKAFRIVNPRIPGRPVQPGTGEDYPAVVFEVAVTEGFTAMIKKANRWLSDQTAVNLWIGIKYNRRANRADDSWWMGVARRDFAAITAGRPANLGADEIWPKPVWIHSLPHNGTLDDGALQVPGDFLNVSDVRGDVWTVPLAVMCHPALELGVPPQHPPIPDLVISVDRFRINIEMYRRQ